MLKTTSQLISHFTQNEEQLAKNYEKLAEKNKDQAETYKKHAKDSRRYIEMLTRAYREGVTDAFEVGFLGNPIDEELFIVSSRASLEDIVVAEDIMIKFCLAAASSSSELLPDLPDTLEFIVKRKKRRLESL